MKKACTEQITMDTALSGMYRRVNKRAEEILAEDGDPIINAYRVVELVKQWERVRDALIKLDNMIDDTI